MSAARAGARAPQCCNAQMAARTVEQPTPAGDLMAPSLLLALLPFITIVSPAHGDFSFRTDEHGNRWESGAALRLALEVPDSLTADDADAEVTGSNKSTEEAAGRPADAEKASKDM